MTNRECFERNVQDRNFLNQFSMNYRVPHVDRDGTRLSVGDEVTCEWPSSWVDGRTGIVLKLGVHSELEQGGHLLQMDGSVTVVPAMCVRRVS